MAWGKGGSKTLDATATQFDITGLSSESTNLIVHSFPSGASAPRTFEVNGTSGTYDVGNCDGGGAIGHSPNYAGSLCDQGGSWGDDAFIVGYMMSIEGKEKIMIYDTVGSNSNGTAPRRRAWASRSNSNTGALTSVTVETSGGSGSIAGSNFSILGSDKTPTLGRPISIQDNSILVEKDTGKRYWFDADPTATTETVFDATTQSAVSTAFCYSGYAFSGTRFGTRIDAGFSGIGKYIKKIMLPLDKTGSPTGNCWYAVFDSSNVEKARTNTKDVSTLPTTSSAGNAEDTELTLESAVKLEAGDIVAFVYEGGSSGNYPQTYSASNTLIANTTPMKYPSNSWSYRPDRNIWFKFDSDPASIILPATWTRDKYTAWYEQAIRDNSVALNGVSGRPYLFGHQNNTGSSKDTKSVTFLLTKYGTGGNGTLTARIYNSSGALQHTSTNSILVSSITGLMGSTFESVTFNFTGATTENTWVVCLHSTGTTSGDNFVACGVDIVTGVTHRVMTGSTSFTTYTDRLITITIKGDN